MNYFNHIQRSTMLLVLLLAGWAAGCPVSATMPPTVEPEPPVVEVEVVEVVPDPSTNLSGTDNGDYIQPLESLNVFNEYLTYFTFSIGWGKYYPAYYKEEAIIQLYDGNNFRMMTERYPVVDQIEFQSVDYISDEYSLSANTGIIFYDAETLVYTWVNTDKASDVTFDVNGPDLRLSGLRLVFNASSEVENRPDAPVFSHESCDFYGPFELTLTDVNEPAATIHYTLDGSTPSAENGLTYSAPITIPAGNDITVKAVSVNETGTSSVTSTTYHYIPSHLFSVRMSNKNGLNYLYYSTDRQYGEWYGDNSTYIADGASVYVGCRFNTGYRCKGVTLNGAALTVSNNSFEFVMPSSAAEVVIDAEFNPSSPADPQPADTTKKYNLSLVSNPSGAASLSGSGAYAAGRTVEISAYTPSGYVFTGWTKDGETISTNNHWKYTMPASDAVLVANYVYNPSNPSDPQQPALKHPLTVIASPSGAGTFNTSGSEVTFGEEYHVYAYPRTGYKFKGWIVNGVAQTETSTHYTGVMTDAGAQVVGLFIFDPGSPSNPGANYYNSTTGQVIIDDFTSGDLYDALRNVVGSSDYSNVSSLIVKGKMSSDDYGALSYLDNAVTIDLSRTGGVTAVPGYAFQDLAVGNILLPSTITSIGNYAFRNCVNLTALTVYAQEPPTCSSYTFNGFTNKDNCTVFVPETALELYTNADYWKDFTILPITDDAHVLQVNLPADAVDGRYKNNSIELVNLNSGVRQKYVISDRLLYTFNGLRKDEQYNIYMLSQAGLELGRIENVTVPDNDFEVTFDSLKSVYNVNAVVTTPDGEDVTADVTVEWLKPLADGTATYLRRATSLGEIPEGQALICRVTLNDRLGTVYVMPEDTEFTVGAEQTTCTVSLVPFRSIALSGTVVDGDGAAFPEASVSVNQTLNGRFSKSYTAKTDRKGQWSLSVLDAPETRLTYAAIECVNVNDTIGAFEPEVSTLDLGNTMLKSIVGARVTYGFTYRAAGAEEVENYYSDYQNVAVNVFNVTQNRAHNEVSLQYPIIAVLDENINVGDELKLTVTSKTGAFNPIEKTVTVGEDERAEVTFDIVGKGGISASFEMTDNPAVTAMLYSSRGELLKKQTYAEAQTTFTELEDGDYTLVTMGQSDLMNSILRLSNFSEIGLTEGKDYVKNAVTVESGKLAEVRNSEIPAFDESLFYYTNSSTSFSSNKSSITTGNYLTLRSAIDFKGVYKNDISNVALVVDLPEACDFVEQSVIQGPNLLPYTLDNNRLTVQLGNNYTSQMRFCVIPTAGGSFNATASIVFDYNGKTLTQPIGAAIAEIKDIEITVPSITATSNFKVSGNAKPNSQVTIFCNDIPVSVTRADKNGSWITECNIGEPVSKQAYSIYAKIATTAGSTIETETKSVVYDIDAVMPLHVTMTFYNGYYRKNYVLVWDFLEQSVSNSHYDFFTTTDFTFRIDFTRNDPDVINDVILCVKTNNGSVVKINAIYDKTHCCWIATDRFSSSALPCNVSVMYNYYDNTICSADVVSNNFANIMPEVSLHNYAESDNACTFTVVDGYSNNPLYYNLYKMYSDKESLQADVVKICEAVSLLPCADELETLNNQYYLDEFGNFLITCTQSPSLYICCDNNSEQQFSAMVNALGLNIAHPVKAYNTLHRIAPVNYGDDQIGESTDWLNQQRDRIIQKAIDEANRKLKCADEYDNIRIHDLIKRLRQSVGLTIGSFFANSASLTMATHGADAYSAISGAGSFGAGMDGISRMGQDALRELHSIPDCGEPEDGNDRGEDFPYATDPILDPSGFVYEAVPTNRVESVQASIYYKETKEDMYGDPYEEIVLWNAEEYAQKNPLFTDENGMYQWDVPQGLWQVKFEKDGYVTAYSEWLPVPPPQLEVNIGIVQNKQPEVTEARAYEEGVEVQFDKFMNLSTLTTSNIYVTANGEKLAGEIRLIDSALADEYADEADADATRYASRVRFVPAEPLSVTTGEVRVTVSRNVLSYAGIPMTETFSQVLDVEKEVQVITADDVKVLYGGEKEVTVYALPYEAAVGRTLRIANSSDLIASVDKTEAVLDEEGKATVIVKGDLPGRAQLTFSIDDVTTTGECAVDVVTEIINAEAPKSSRASGTAVYRGTKVELTTESKDGVIYFTTDGSCPCDENGTRRKYTVPIVINDDTQILAMTSVGNGDDDVSETVEFNYTLKRSDMDFAMEEGWTWISHNFDAPVAAETLAADENVHRIMSQTQEVIRDPQLGMVGMLRELNATESYKVETTSATARQRLSEVAWNPATPIALNSGWNWLGYPVGQTMSVDEAFAPTAAENLDVIVGQNGFAQFNGESWVGTLETLSPGMGYMYQSQSPKNVVYNTSIVSTASARYAAGISQNTPLVLDIHKYPSIMPVVATIKSVDGMNLDNEDYQVNAFCGTECRGIGRVVNGLVMMNVYGNAGDKIIFQVTDNEGAVQYANNSALTFSENIVGNLTDPHAIAINSQSGISDVTYDGNIKVGIVGDMLVIKGIAADNIDFVELYDAAGHKLIHETNVSEAGIKVSQLNTGIYVVIVNGNGEYTYHKVALR